MYYVNTYQIDLLTDIRMYKHSHQQIHYIHTHTNIDVINTLFIGYKYVLSLFHVYNLSLEDQFLSLK